MIDLNAILDDCICIEIYDSKAQVTNCIIRVNKRWIRLEDNAEILPAALYNLIYQLLDAKYDDRYLKLRFFGRKETVLYNGWREKL